MDKRTFYVIMSLIVVAIIFNIYSVEKSTYFDLKGIFSGASSGGSLVLLGIIALLIYVEYNKYKKTLIPENRKCFGFWCIFTVHKKPRDWLWSTLQP
jgi:hypothetical protein